MCCIVPFYNCGAHCCFLGVLFIVLRWGTPMLHITCCEGQVGRGGGTGDKVIRGGVSMGNGKSVHQFTVLQVTSGGTP